MAKTISKTISKAKTSSSNSKAPKAAPKGQTTSKAASQTPSQAKAPKGSQATSKAPKAASKAAPKASKVNLATTAKVVPVVPGLKGSVKHRATFEGKDLIQDLQAASQYGDSYILQTGQLDQATRAAIEKALYQVPCYKGLHWGLANLQIIPESGASKAKK